jgi:hypothetical protein
VETLRGDPAFEPILRATEASLAAQRQVLARTPLAAYAPPSHPAPLSLPAAELDGLTGYFSERQRGALVEVQREGDALFAIDAVKRRLRLYAAGPDSFFDGETSTRYEFKRGADGKATSVTRWRTGFPSRNKRVAWEPPKPGRAEPQRYGEYVGTYRVDKQRSVRVWTEGGKLWGQQTGEPRVEAQPESGDLFYLSEAPMRLRFERDGDRKVVAMRVIQPDGELLLERIK